jgi:hypothetical protein
MKAEEARAATVTPERRIRVARLAGLKSALDPQEVYEARRADVKQRNVRTASPTRPPE